jgi:flagellar hook-basal body complex protein FliE
MSIPIDAAGGIPLAPTYGPFEGAIPKPSETTDPGASFAAALGDALHAHSLRAGSASELASSFAAGATEDIHGTMIAVKQVEIELHLIANVRRKVLDAFNELWRMNV